MRSSRRGCCDARRWHACTQARRRRARGGRAVAPGWRAGGLWRARGWRAVWRRVPVCEEQQLDPAHSPLRHLDVARSEVRLDGHRPVLVGALLRRHHVDVVRVSRQPRVERRRRRRVSHVPRPHEQREHFSRRRRRRRAALRRRRNAPPPQPDARAVVVAAPAPAAAAQLQRREREQRPAGGLVSHGDGERQQRRQEGEEALALVVAPKVEVHRLLVQREAEDPLQPPAEVLLRPHAQPVHPLAVVAVGAARAPAAAQPAQARRHRPDAPLRRRRQPLARRRVVGVSLGAVPRGLNVVVDRGGGGGGGVVVVDGAVGVGGALVQRDRLDLAQVDLGAERVAVLEVALAQVEHEALPRAALDGGEAHHQRALVVLLVARREVLEPAVLVARLLAAGERAQRRRDAAAHVALLPPLRLLVPVEVALARLLDAVAQREARAAVAPR